MITGFTDSGTTIIFGIFHDGLLKNEVLYTQENGEVTKLLKNNLFIDSKINIGLRLLIKKTGFFYFGSRKRNIP